MCIFESKSEARCNICFVVGQNETFWKKFASMLNKYTIHAKYLKETRPLCETCPMKKVFIMIYDQRPCSCCLKKRQRVHGKVRVGTVTTGYNSIFIFFIFSIFYCNNVVIQHNAWAQRYLEVFNGCKFPICVKFLSSFLVVLKVS